MEKYLRGVKGNNLIFLCELSMNDLGTSDLSHTLMIKNLFKVSSRLPAKFRGSTTMCNSKKGQE